MNQYPKKQFLDTALFAAESASRLIQKTSNRSVKAYKSKTDLVTETDIASEEITMQEIPLSNLREDKHISFSEKLIEKLNNFRGTYVRAPKMSS